MTMKRLLHFALLLLPCRIAALLREATGYTSLSAPSAYSSSSLLQSDGGCPVVAMIPYTIGHGRWPARAHTRLSFDWLSSAWLAMEHFNARDASVVPALADWNDAQCSIYFPKPIVLDSAMEGPAAVSALWSATGVNGRPCAVLGPMDPRAVEEVAAITNALDVPQLFYFAELSRFWQDDEGITVGMVLSPNARAHIMAEWLSTQQQPQRDYLAVLHWGKDGSSDLADELKEIGPDYDMVVQTFLRQGRRQLPRLIDQVYESGISTIMLNFDNPKSLSSMANAFADKGMLTEEYLYIISPDSLPTDHRLNENYNPEPNSNLDKLLSNALVFDIVAPFRTDTQGNDPFLKAWRQLGATFVQQINQANPLPQDHEAYFQAPSNYFQTNLPSNYASIVYDSIILLGMSACHVQQQYQGNQTDFVLDREELILQMHNSTFQGASGPISPFPQEEAYRSATNDLQVGLYQIQPIATTTINETDTVRSYQPTLAYLWSQGTWEQKATLQGVLPPALLPDLVQHNYLSPSIRIVGFTIVGLTWAIALGAMAAILKLQHTSDTITRAQPFFLLLTCIGSIITSTSILTLSWDESYGATQDQLDALCMSSLWTFFIGHVCTFMALFSKLYRIDKVLQFRRNNVVSVRQVLGPLTLLLGLTLLILIVWTSVDPWTWQRTWVTRMPPETYGECRSDHFWAFFGPLMGILVVAEGLTTFFAVRTSDVPQDFGDSRTSLFAIYTHVQSWVFGVPVLVVLGNASTDATYIARVLLIWIFSISSVLVVVGPRIHRAMLVEPFLDDDDQAMSTSRVRVTGLDNRRGSQASPEDHDFQRRNNRLHGSSLTMGGSSSMASGGKKKQVHSSSSSSSGDPGGRERKPSSALSSSSRLEPTVEFTEEPSAEARAEKVQDCYDA